MLREAQFLFGVIEIAFDGEGFAEVTPENGSVGLEGRGDLQILACSGAVSVTETAQGASEPRITKGGVDGDGVIEERLGLAGAALLREGKAAERDAVGVAGGQCEAAVERAEGGVHSAETHFEFGDADPGEGEVGRNRRGGSRGVKSRRQQ